MNMRMSTRTNRKNIHTVIEGICPSPDFPRQAEQAVEDGQGARRAARDEKIDRQQGRYAVMNLRMVDIRTVRNGSGTDGDHSGSIRRQGRHLPAFLFSRL